MQRLTPNFDVGTWYCIVTKYNAGQKLAYKPTCVPLVESLNQGESASNRVRYGPKSRCSTQECPISYHLKRIRGNELHSKTH